MDAKDTITVSNIYLFYNFVFISLIKHVFFSIGSAGESVISNLLSSRSFLLWNMNRKTILAFMS
jgi:hypothetical protein